nr:unnamed protein product [Callosobruchus analis]
MWKTLKELVNTKNESIDYTSIDKPNSEDSIQSTLNKFFVDSINNIVSSIPQSNSILENMEVCKSTGNLSYFPIITLNRLRKTIMQLNSKATGDELLTVRLIKELFDTIGYPLLNIINTSLQNGILPPELKKSTVVPVPKTRNPGKYEDLRPINLMPVVEKILEILVHGELVDHLVKNEILYEGQSGFRQDHSCETACQLVCAKWKKEIDEGKIIVSVFVDLKRAFETIDRKRLLEKCEKYGLKGVVLKWLNDYLSNRWQRVKIENVYSECLKVEHGVPQGSVLGPLLFLIYINDIQHFLKESFISLFADDTLISVSGSNIKHVVEIVNREMIHLSEWLKCNKIKLNVQKTKCMVIGSRHNCQRVSDNISVKIDDISISVVDQIKYLGVQIDQQLNFSKHVDYICKKLGKKIGYFRRIAPKLSTWCKRVVYNTIIYPHFTYCSSLLIACSAEDKHKLQLLLNKCMRILLGCSKYTPIRDMLNNLKFLNIEQIIQEANLVLLFKIINKKAPNYFEKFMYKRMDVTDYNIRTKDHYCIDRYRSKSMEKSLFIEGLKLYNKLPLIVKNSPNVQIFKKRLRAMYFDM